jgi:soluble lytic murein transglycosylase
VEWPARASLPPAFARAAALDSLGLDLEARFERDHLAAEAKGADGLRTVALQFAAAGSPSRASQLASRAISAGATRDAALWRLVYPLPYEKALRAAAGAERIDPLLVASVIRQESAFDPHATSRTDARGLLQVEPGTGKDGARSLGFPDFDPALLWVADVNLAIGMRHLAAALGRYPELERALAAYNAGTTPVDRWSASLLTRNSAVKAPLDDPELFVERIPFVETRGYVRAIERNLAVYRMLYEKR